VSRIESYALIGDLQTAALVGRDGAVDWLCLPRFDSPACFAALLGDEENGRWRIAPVGAAECMRRQYRADTLVLETEWDTPEGSVRVIDLMPPRGEALDVVRIVEGLSGRVTVRSELRLRFDYGSVKPWVKHDDGGLRAVAGPDAVWLSAPVDVHGEDWASWCDVEVGAGDREAFVLTYRPSHEPAPRPVDAEQALADTEAFWREWIGSCQTTGPWDEAVRRSLITLKALTYAPTGGIVAAATTSLPEDVGGVRNWDYRYCWLRDASFTLQALLASGFTSEASAWREWLLRAVAGDPADLQIMYGLDGTRRLTEYEVDWLAGYEGSRPVRIGNGAAGQYQLDVWGEVLDALHQTREAGLAPDEDAWDLQRALLGYLERHWQEPDNGLWEVRGPRRHFVHSKVLAWAGVDRMVRTARAVPDLPADPDRWAALADAIHEEVCREGYDAERGTFTQYYGSKDVDAALLLIPRVGFLPWDDPRVAGTVAAVQHDLCADGFVQRYLTHGEVDGLPGGEGAFLACSFWLADALLGLGRYDESRELFERLLSLRNDVGLLAEEWDERGKRQVGNVPQAFSHVALVNTARQLTENRMGTTTQTTAVRGAPGSGDRLGA
jgi:GH15 family glucan-1,4-alpha-glucosidase